MVAIRTVKYFPDEEEGNQPMSAPSPSDHDQSKARLLGPLLLLFLTMLLLIASQTPIGNEVTHLVRQQLYSGGVGSPSTRNSTTMATIMARLHAARMNATLDDGESETTNPSIVEASTGNNHIPTTPTEVTTSQPSTTPATNHPPSPSSVTSNPNAATTIAATSATPLLSPPSPTGAPAPTAAPTAAITTATALPATSKPSQTLPPSSTSPPRPSPPPPTTTTPPLTDVQLNDLARTFRMEMLTQLQRNQAAWQRTLDQRLTEQRRWASGGEFEEAEYSRLVEEDTLLYGSAGHLAPSSARAHHDSSLRALDLKVRYKSDGPWGAAVKGVVKPVTPYPPEAVNHPSFFRAAIRFCSLENVCIGQENPKSILLHTNNATLYLQLAKQVALCDPTRKDSSARCICLRMAGAALRPYQLRVKSGEAQQLLERVRQEKWPWSPELESRLSALTDEDLLPLPTNHVNATMYPDPMRHPRGHYWANVRAGGEHHIGHFTNRMGMLQATLQHPRECFSFNNVTFNVTQHPYLDQCKDAQRIPPFEGLLMDRDDWRTTAQEELMMMSAIDTAVGTQSVAYADAQLEWLKTCQTSNSDKAYKCSSSPLVLPPFVAVDSWQSNRGVVVWKRDLQFARFDTALDSSDSATATTRSGYTCFNRLTFSPITGSVGVHPSDTQRWQMILKERVQQLQQAQQLQSQRDPEFAVALSSQKVNVPATVYPTPQRPHALGLPPSCPPRRVTLLWRHNRRIHNFNEVMNMLARKLNLTWADITPHAEMQTVNKQREQMARELVIKRKAAAEAAQKVADHLTSNSQRTNTSPDLAEAVGARVAALNAWSALGAAASIAIDLDPFNGIALPQLQYASVDERSSPLSQASLFASSGLILASHSSQLLNLLFSHPHVGVIEIFPEVRGCDFAHYAFGMDKLNNYAYALGGAKWIDKHSNGTTPTLISPDPAQMNCTASIHKSCLPSMSGRCVMDHCRSPPHCQGARTQQYQNNNYLLEPAGLAELERLVDQAIEKIEQQCQGKWASGFEQERIK